MFSIVVLLSRFVFGEMFTKTFILVLMCLSASAQYTPSTDAYIFNGLLPLLHLGGFVFDGPANVSYAPTTPTTNAKPTLPQMMYYNYYSAAMYCQYQLSDLSCEYCNKFKGDVDMRKVLLNNNTDVTALITLSKNRGEIVVTFRGTQNIFNAVLGATMYNICFDTPDCDIRLHLGLYTATLSIYDKVIMNIGYLLSLYPKYKVVITGHSLGGALARITTFLILYLEQFPGTNLEVYTYGEVRVGNKGFVDFMNAQNITTARVVARADVIPHFIPVSVLGTTALGDYYMHVQTEYWINGLNNQKFADTSVYTDPTCSDSMGPAYSVLDHFQYFDANYLICYLNQPLVFLAIPASILQPIGTIPPLPTKISNFLGAALGFVSGLLGGLFG